MAARPERPSSPRVLDAAATTACLDWTALVAALRRATVELRDGRIACPPRSVVALRDGTTLLSMPAVADDLAIHKLITVAPRNAGRSLPVILGTTTLLDPVTGQATMTLDGPTVTGRRTAALSMLALSSLRPGPVGRVLLIGTGVQARHHAEALAALHPHAPLAVRGTSVAAAEAFCRGGSGRAVATTDDDDFDVVVACTTSRVPVYRGPARGGCLVIATGSFAPDVAEIDARTVRASTVYVDDPVGARHEAGDLLLAGVDWTRVLRLAEAIDHGPASGPVLFKSVGCAAWDLAAARVARDAGPPD